MARHWTMWIIPAVMVSSCGQDDLASFSIKIRSAAVVQDSLRRFPPGEPTPDRVRVDVFRSDDLSGKAVATVDVGWSEMEEDPTTQKKYLLVNVPANEDKNYRYLLRVSSVVAGQVDECGAIGQILAVKGAKKKLEIETHEGNCSGGLCQSEGNCFEDQYCLSFECHDVDGTCECPDGAYCSELNECAADCSSDENLCTHEFVCCYGICSAHCPG